MRKRALKNTTPAENHRRRYGTRQFNCDVPQELLAALDKYCKREGEKRKIVVVRVLLRFLIREGVLRG